MANMGKASLVTREKQKSQSANITQPTSRLKSFLMTTPSVGEDVETTGTAHTLLAGRYIGKTTWKTGSVSTEAQYVSPM